MAAPPTVWDYSGIVATAYDSFFGAEPYFDQALFTQRVAVNAGPALELACGTGRLLLPMLRDGLAVEGLDTSADMLDILRRKAAARCLAPTLHQRPMQDFDLPGRYATIFCAVNSVQILVEDAEIDAALACCLRALRPGGELILTYAMPPTAWTRAWRERRQVTLDDGAQVLIEEQTHPHATLPRWRWDLRWRITRGSDTQQLLQSFELRDYSDHGLAARLFSAGFDSVTEQRGYTDSDTASDTSVRVVFARRPAR
jgi:SAM-dependent methyltransferase